MTHAAPVADLADGCGDDPGSFCEWVFDRTDNETLAQLADWFMERPLRIVLIAVIALAVNRIARRAIGRFTHRLATFTDERRLNAILDLGVDSDEAEQVRESERQRRTARAETIAQVLRSTVTAAVSIVAGLMVLGELNVNLGPLLAGAGIAGVAIGFGAQSIVRDFLSGVFILIEDQFGVGDHVDLGPASGDVEKLSLRTTTIRDSHGTVWYVPNGEIRRVGNSSQLSSRAVLDVTVPYDTDLRRALSVVDAVAAGLQADAEWSPLLASDKPDVLGVQSLGPDGVVLRVSFDTEATMQANVERELRLRVKEAFEAEGITIAPQRTVWVRPTSFTDTP